MVCARFRSFLLGLFFLFVTVGDFIAATEYVSENFPSEDQIHGDNVNKVPSTEAEERLTERNIVQIHARKMMGPISRDEEKATMLNTGEFNRSPNELLVKSNKTEKVYKLTRETKENGLKSVDSSKETALNSHSSPKFRSGNENSGSKEKSPVLPGANEQFQKIEMHKFARVVTELYSMMAKDYHATAKRKPPINNNQPLDGIYVKP